MRFRDFGIHNGTLPTGSHNAITDVDGVRVGHETCVTGDDVRTGVTAILPHGDQLFTQKVPAAVHTINGFGKACGFEQVRELGTIETPIILTNTLSVGRANDALIDYTLSQHPTATSINPLVGECNDSYLNDIRQRVITSAHVQRAIATAQGGTVREGCVGAGTGTQCYGLKGGIGTASRRCADGYQLGALVQTNFGRLPELTICGVPIGQHLAQTPDPPAPDGSVMIVLATSAPLTARQLQRLTHRAAFGLARTGTICHHGSGDFVIAFSTAYRQTGTTSERKYIDDRGEIFNTLFQATVEAVEEAVYNALIAAETTQGYAGHTLHGLTGERLQHWLRHYRRL